MRVKKDMSINKKFLKDSDKNKSSLKSNKKFEYLETLKFIDNKKHYINMDTFM